MSAATIIERLQGVRATSPTTWLAKCPSHADRSLSLSIRELADGRVLLNCFAGCGGANVVEALGLQWSDLFPAALEPFARSGRHAPVPTVWALEVLHRESLVVAIAASDIAAGRALSSIDSARVEQAAGRIASIVERTQAR